MHLIHPQVIRCPKLPWAKFDYLVIDFIPKMKTEEKWTKAPTAEILFCWCHNFEDSLNSVLTRNISTTKRQATMTPFYAFKIFFFFFFFAPSFISFSLLFFIFCSSSSTWKKRSFVVTAEMKRNSKTHFIKNWRLLICKRTTFNTSWRLTSLGRENSCKVIN